MFPVCMILDLVLLMLLNVVCSPVLAAVFILRSMCLLEDYGSLYRKYKLNAVNGRFGRDSMIGYYYISLVWFRGWRAWQ